MMLLSLAYKVIESSRWPSYSLNNLGKAVILDSPLRQAILACPKFPVMR